MDALSICMAILQTIGAITAMIKTAKSIYNAPDELESLLNDLSEGQIMVLDIKHHLGQPVLDRLPENNLQKALREAEQVLSQSDNLIQNLLSKPQDPKSTRRWAWYKAKKKILKLRSKLARIHEELPRRLGQVESSRIKLELTDISFVQQHTLQQVSGLSKGQEKLAEAIQLSRQLQEHISSSVDEIRRSTLHRLDRLESTSLTTDSGAGISRLSIRDEKQPPSSAVLSDSSVAHPMQYSSADINASSSKPIYQSLKVTAQYRRPSSCSLLCRCHCHLKKTVATPSVLAGLIGQMFIGYKGIAMVAKSCTEKNCKQNPPELSIYATYFFPNWWILNQSMLLVVRQRAILGPEIILRFPRYISFTSRTAIFTWQGKVDDLKKLFADGKASPNDLPLVSYDNVMSLPEFALKFRQFSTLKFLVQAGAALDIEDSGGSIIADIVCRMLFGERGGVPKEHEQWMMETFMSHHIENIEFSGLHKAILGLRATKIHEEISRLSSTGSTIDSQDSWGYTPLHWACIRGDKEAISQLIESGADPNITTEDNQACLNLALWSGNVDLALYLLNHGANACYITKSGWSAFQVAAAYCESHPSIIILLDKLYQLGADINAINLDQGSPPMQAIQHNSHLTLRWLLNHGGDCSTPVAHGTMLHYAAFFGDLQTMEILREARFSDIDIHIRNDNNDTAMDRILSQDRIPIASDELIASFVRLLSEIEARTNGKSPDLCEIVNEKNPEIISADPGQVVEQMLDPSIENSEDEEDFVNSVEFQTD